MAICGKKKRDELDKILKDTKFSSRTKGLMTYYSSDFTPKIEKIFVALLRSNIPVVDVKPLTLILYDASRNGCSRIAGYEFHYGVGQWIQKISEDTDFVCMVHSKIRKSTLKRWRNAIFLIDLAKRNKKGGSDETNTA